MFWILLVFNFSVINAALNYTRLITGPALSINTFDSSYSSNIILFCNDYGLPKTVVDRTFYFNEGTLLNNTELKSVENQPLLTITHPTFDNTGNYDCCVKTVAAFENGTKVDETTCFRTGLTVTEYSHYLVENNANISLSLKRNNYLAIFDNVNVSMVACKFNGTDLPSNIKTMYTNTTFTPYFSIFNQFVILETDAKNLGSYFCTSMDSNAQVLSKNFTLSEAPTRIYPWIGKDGAPTDPTDNGGNNQNNSAIGDYGNMFKSVLALFLLSAFVF
uniref:Ig-like domain-containing protein n=1 Tax=Panagrolaimus sp. ES5 TaxID=591445 RepID=A0AC34FTS1_9BILA